MLSKCQLSFIKEWLKSGSKLEGPAKDSNDFLPMSCVLQCCSDDRKGSRVRPTP